MAEHKIFRLWAGVAGRAKQGLARFGAAGAFTLAAYVLLGADLFAELPGAGGQAIQAMLPGCLWGFAAAAVLRLTAERLGTAALARWLPWGGGLAAFAVASVLWYGDAGMAWSLAYGGLLLAAACAAVWLLYGRENQDELFGYLVSSLCFAGAVALVLMLGLLLCLAAVDALLLSVLARVYLMAVYLPWIMVLPNLFLGGLPPLGGQVKVTRAYHVLTAWVALPVYLLLLAVLYGYVGKIVFTRQMPAGTMNWYASFALAAYLFFWLGLRMEKSRWVQTVLRWGWAALLPVVAVQLVGVGIRLHAYGLTFWRMAGLVCLLVGLVGLVLAARRKSPRLLFAAAGAAALVFTLSPLNLADLPRWQQAGRLQSLLVQNQMWDGERVSPAPADISHEDKEDIRSSWRYLWLNAGVYSRGGFAAAAVPENADNESFAAQYGFALWEGDAELTSYHSYQLSGGQSLAVAGYRQLYLLEGQYLYRESANGWLLEESWADGTALQADLTDWLNELVQRYGDADVELTQEECTLELPEGRLVLYGVEVGVTDGRPNDLYIRQACLLVP